MEPIMADTLMSKARELCTASELGLVAASRPTQLARLSQPELKRKIFRARTLRDKWRDLATRQRRGAQSRQAARVTDKNARSGEKHVLFAEVLARFEAQWEKVSSGAAGGGAGKGDAASRPPKQKRAKIHRRARAEVRAGMEEERARRAARSAPPARKVAAAPASAAGEAASDASAPAAKPRKKKPARRPAKKASKTAAQAAAKSGKKVKASGKKAKKKPSRPPATAEVESPLNTSRGKQLAAVTAAKRDRLKRSGVQSRIRGHVSARGKRSQSRRDSRR
jgi:hypothetical protein